MIEPTPKWRAIFWCEIALCAATCIAWIVAPDAFLTGVFGLDPGDARARLLLAMTANVVGCAYVYLYARLLLGRPFQHVAFRYLQQAMAIGDVVVLGTSAAEAVLLTPSATILALQIGMAALWLGTRLAWLWQTRALADR